MADIIDLTREKFTNIANAIRSVTGSEEEFTVDEMPSAIEELSKGTSVEGGYVVSFYDENDILIQVSSIMNGLTVDAPEYECDTWQTLDGAVQTFPLIVTGDLNLYARTAPMYVDQLYRAVGLIKSEYRYVSLIFQSGYSIKLKFFNDYSIDSYKAFYIEGDYFSVTVEGAEQPSDYDDLAWVVNYVVNGIGDKFLNGNGLRPWESASSSQHFYVNFDLVGTDAVIHRLDTPMPGYEKIDPYVLQEKTVTSNGEVIPDEDYYGLSKVTVNVTPNLQEKTVNENGEIIADEGYDGLSKVIVDVESGVGIDGGYVANFYNENEELIHTVVTRATIPVIEPEYDCGAWTDGIGGQYAQFPVLLTKDMDYYAVPVTTYASMLYAHFGVSEIDYPYILLTVQFGGSFTHATVYFSPNQHSASDSSFFVAGQSIRARYTPSGDYDWDMKTAVEKIIENATTTESFNGGNGHSSTRESHDIYGNFENEYLDGRLDTPVEEEVSPFYTVNFYDYDQELIETHTAKVGNQIGSPLSFNAAWKDSESSICTFPMTCDIGGQIINIYAYNEAIAEKIYAHYNIDSSVYPYLTIDILNNSIYLTFSKSIKAVTSNQFETIDCYTGQAYDISAVDITEIENVLYEKIGSGSLTYTSSLSWDSNMGTYYLNYDMPTSECSATVYDLRV